MTQEFELAVSSRTDIGKGASRRLRHNGNLPGIVYGGGEEPTSIHISHHVLYHAYEFGHLSGLFSLNIDGKIENVITRDIQHHPYKPFIQHIDFLRVNKKELIKVEVPLHFIGEADAPGIKTEHGTLARQINEIEVECPAGKIPESIDVDVSSLHLGDNIHINDLVLPEGATLPILFEFDTLSEEEQNAVNQVVVSITAQKSSANEDETTEVSETEETDEKSKE